MAKDEEVESIEAVIKRIRKDIEGRKDRRSKLRLTLL